MSETAPASDEIVVQDREELIYLLCEAAEFEHAVMCTYLYAQWTLKRGLDEDLTPAELAAIDRWRRTLARVALEEMLHLSLVNNLLAAVGASPHLWRPAFPVRAGHFPADVVMNLAPFGQAALEHFMYIERPEGVAVADGAGFVHGARYQRIARPDMLAPSPQDYATQGQLYHGILQGLERLAGQLGEQRVFVGHGQAQVCSDEFGLPGLFRIDDLASARRALEQIVQQGEGAPAHREDSHFARFRTIRQELGDLRAGRPGFEPARRVVRNPLLGTGGNEPDRVRIVEPLAAKVVDLANSVYALMVRALSQVFAPAPLPAELRVGLAGSATALMSVMGRLAEVATRLPADAALPAATAAPNFDLPASTGQLVQQCAAQILGERAAELAGAARRLGRDSAALGDAASELDALALRFGDLHERFESHIGAAVDRVAGLAPVPPAAESPPPGDLPHASAEAGAAPEEARSAAITLRFDGRRCIHSRHCVLEAPAVFLANTPGAWIHPEATSVEHCVAVAHNCPSGAISYERHDGGPQETAPSVNVLRVRENGPYAVHAEVGLPSGGALRVALCRCGQSRSKPFCDGSHGPAAFTATGEPATVGSEPLGERGGPLRIEPIRNGPLHFSGSVEICSGTGRTVLRTRSTRLCRCGGSQNKPFCDGSHARLGFRTDD